MLENWRYTATSITKYNPIYRDANGHYTKNEWIGFFQLGKVVDGNLLTLEKYLEVEQKYIEAAYRFLQFHNCDAITLKNLEKYDHSSYDLEDKDQLILFYNRISNNQTIPAEDLNLLIKLILRELAWGELFCSNIPDTAIRFGYDLYMYFNSNRDMTPLFMKIRDLGLYIGRTI